MMEYKGYTGIVEFDEEAEAFVGEVLHLRDVITFQGSTVRELKKAFEDSIDDYLEFCDKKGITPEKPYSGNVLLRLPPTLHRDVVGAAARAGESLNQWVVTVLRRSLSEPFAPYAQDEPEPFVQSVDLSVVEDSLKKIWGIHHPVAQRENKVYSWLAGERHPAVTVVKVGGEQVAQFHDEALSKKTVRGKVTGHVC